MYKKRDIARRFGLKDDELTMKTLPDLEQAIITEIEQESLKRAPILGPDNATITRKQYIDQNEVSHIFELESDFGVKDMEGLKLTTFLVVK